jgi:hypothetical protein
MPGWVMAVFAAMALLVPAGVYFTASFFGYIYGGYGTGPALGPAPGPLLGMGVIPALLAIGVVYWVARRSRRVVRPANDGQDSNA